MLTQEEWVQSCLSKYRWEPLPANQKWEAAHFPLPECLGGEETVLLWSADHTVQGLLQSVELDYKCFYHSANSKDLYNLETYYPEYLELFQQLKSQFSSRQGKKTAELGVGVHGQSAEQKTANGKKGGKKLAELKTGCHAPGMASKGGKKAVELKTGCHAPGIQSKGGKKVAELKIGIHAPEMLGVGGKIGGKITSAQQWQCLVTEHICNAGALARYQKKRGIDTSLRTRRADLEG